MGWLSGKPTGQGAKSGHWETVSPRKYRADHQASNRKAVEFYKRNPNGRFDGRSGEPFAYGGKLLNGNHRAQAAAETGRKLRVWVEDPR